MAPVPLILAVGVVAALAALSPPSLAQSPHPEGGKQAPDGAPAAERVVITGSQGESERSNSAASVTTVTRDSMLRNGDASVVDALRRIAGITVGGGASSRDAEIRMRGLGSGYTQILINGEPAPPGFQIGSLLPTQIDRIEISKTARSDVSGQAIAGTINIILRTDTRATQPPEFRVSSAAGRIGTETAIETQYSQAHGPVVMGFSASLQEDRKDFASALRYTGSDAVRVIEDRTTDRRMGDDNTIIGLRPRLEWKVGPAETLVVDGLIQSRRQSLSWSDTLASKVGTPPPYQLGISAAKTQTSLVSASLAWTRDLAGAARISLKASANRSDRDSKARVLNFDTGGLQVLDRHIDAEETNGGRSLSTRFNAPYVADHDIVAGFEIVNSTRIERRIQRDVVPVDVVPDDRDESFDTAVTRVSVYLQDEWILGPRLTALLGVRSESLVAHVYGSELESFRNRYNLLGPAFNFLWKPAAGHSVRLAVGRTFKTPTPRELTPRRWLSSDNTPASPDFQGRPNLKPERSLGVDAAYEVITAAWSATASLTYRRIDDVVLDRVELIGDRYVQSPFNAGHSVVGAIEGEGRLSLRKADPSLPNVDIRLGLARNLSRVDSVSGPNNRLANQVPMSASVGVEYRPDDVYALGGSFAFEGGGVSRAADNQSRWTSARRVLDAYVRAYFSRDATIRISVVNALGMDRETTNTFNFGSGQQVYGSVRTPTFQALKAQLEVKFR